MASSRSDSTSRETPNKKRSILRRSCASSEASEYRVEDQESASDDLIRNERARRLAQEMDSPVEAVLAALKRQKVYEGPSDHGDYRDDGPFGPIASAALHGSHRPGNTRVFAASSSSSSRLSPIPASEDFTPWRCRGPQDFGPCQACSDAADFFQRQHCQLDQLSDQDSEASSLSSDVDQGTPGAGKTTMISNLETWFKLRVYWWPRDEAWWDGYEDGAYDLIVLDEFKSQKKITELNPILSGDTVPLSRRRAPPYVKRENLPVIILSNYLPEECFHRCTSQALAPLLDRLEIVEVSNYVRIERVEEEEIESV